ncbi:unnamed protein product, partial [Anisakis simplex]
MFRAIQLDDKVAKSDRASVLVIFKAIMSLYCRPIQLDRNNSVATNADPYRYVPVCGLVPCQVSCMLYLLILSRQSRIRRLCASLSEFLMNFDEDKSRIDSKLLMLAEFCAEPSRAIHSFKHFAEFLSRNDRCRQLMKNVFGESSTCEKVESALSELLEQLHESNSGLSKEDAQAVQSVLERGAPLQIDTEAICDLVQKIYQIMERVLLFDDCVSDALARANTLLRVMAEHFPKCFQNETVLMVIVKILDFEDMTTVENAMKVIKLVSPRVVDDSSAEFVANHSRILRICKRIAANGNPRAAKYAV